MQTLHREGSKQAQFEKNEQNPPISWSETVTPQTWKENLSLLQVIIHRTRKSMLQFHDPVVTCLGALSCSVISGSLQPCERQAVGLLYPRHFSGKSTGVVCHFLLQRIFQTWGSNPCLLHWQAESLPLGHMGSPVNDLRTNEKLLWINWGKISESWGEINLKEPHKMQK